MTDTDILDWPLIQAFIKGLSPEEQITVTQWADTHRMLSSISSFESGLYRSSRTPYLKKIMDVLSPHHPCRKIIFMKASQVGGTEIGLNWIGAIICTAPGGILMVSPSDNNAKRNSKIRIGPMIKETKPLKERIKSAKIREGGNTVLQKDFDGGFLVLTGSNSPADLKSLPVRYTLLDEVDEYPPNLDGQGSVIELTAARQRNFPNSKMYMNSTPRLESNSIIAAEFAETDQNYYHVPCPHCGTLQKLEFEQLVCEDHKDYSDVKYRCAHCTELIDERYKIEMLDLGDWVSECPDKINIEVMGFHINALYSPWYSWARIMQDHDNAQKDETKMPTFNNTILGLPHKQKGERPEYMAIFNKRVSSYVPNKPPVEVCVLTAGLDVQGDRIECEVVGWAKGKRSYSVDYRVYRGDTSKPEVWASLRPLFTETWQRKDGLILPLRHACIDSGHNQSKVYDFCRLFSAQLITPIKGGPPSQGVIIGAPRLVDYNKEGKTVGKIRSWNVGVSMLKGELYGNLRMERDDEGNYPPGYCFFPQEGHYSGVEYFKGLCSEALEITTDKSGKAKYLWVKKERLNEALDCRVYARAAFSLIGGDRFQDQHYEALAGQGVSKPVKKKPRDGEKDWL
jgi:phage terminase large subunit GpA-like protein